MYIIDEDKFLFIKEYEVPMKISSEQLKSRL